MIVLKSVYVLTYSGLAVAGGVAFAMSTVGVLKLPSLLKFS